MKRQQVHPHHCKVTCVVNRDSRRAQLSDLLPVLIFEAEQNHTDWAYVPYGLRGCKCVGCIGLQSSALKMSDAVYCAYVKGFCLTRSRTGHDGAIAIRKFA
jgi:hypothetical protein